MTEEWIIKEAAEAGFNVFSPRRAQIIELVPPYTMSCMVQDFCPSALSIPFGKIVNGAHPLHGREAHLSVSDVLLEPNRPIRELELKCVASETILGVLGLTLLEARSLPVTAH